MNKCWKCGAEFEGLFCPQCGTKFEKEKLCPNCQSIVDGGVRFCNNCGYAFEQETVAVSNSVKPNHSRQTVMNVRPFSVFNVLVKILPVVSMFALALFSLLLWTFFCAPFATVFGESIGNVYTTINGVIDDFLPVAQASVAFAVISLVYSAFVIISLYVPQLSKINTGKLSLTKILTLCGNVLYIPFFALGCAALAKSNKIGVEKGSFAAVTIAFSVIFAVTALGSIVVDLLLHRKCPAYRDAISAKKCEKVEREKQRQQLRAESRAQSVQILAEHGIVEPVAVERPDRSVRAKLQRVNGGVLENTFVLVVIILGILLAVMTALLSALGTDSVRKSSLIIILGVFAAFVAIVAVVLGVVCKNKRRLYRIKSQKETVQNSFELIDAAVIKKRIKSNRIALIVFAVLAAISTFMIIGVNLVVDKIFESITVFYLMLVGTILSIQTVSFIFVFVALINYSCGNKIKRIFGLDGKTVPQISVMTENGTELLTLEKFCQLSCDYDIYRSELRYYNYNLRLASRGKTSVEKMVYNARVKKIKTIIISCACGVVVLALIIGLIADSLNIFKTSKVEQIHNGMTKEEVVKVLGKTEYATDYIWTYYSFNYVKMLRKAEDLTKQMANVQNVEEMNTIQQKMEKLAKQMANTKYKYIKITFDTDGKVTQVDYNFNYKPIQADPTQTCAVIW